MISLLDLAGALAAACAVCLLFSQWRRRLASSERWMIFAVCLLTALINIISFYSWLGEPVSANLAENWGDFLQILQPAFWGMFFYVVVQSAQKRELQQSRENMRAIVENMPLALHAYDKQGRLTSWNREAERISGYSEHEIVGNTDALVLLYPDEKEQQSLLQECDAGGGDYHHRIRSMQCKNGSKELAWYNISKKYPISGWANWCIGLDMTDQLAAQRKLEHLATHDELTTLPNRTLLRDRLQHALDDCLRNQRKGALLMLDLDHFKMVNDCHGHPVGDQLLLEIAKRVQTCLKSTDTLARFSGDEFVALLENVDAVEDATFVAERILNTIGQQPFNIFGNEIRIRASIGITCFPDDDVRVEELMKNMDLALYAAKERGRNSYHLYSRNMHKRFRRQHKISEQLRLAMERDMLALHYQPKVDLKDECVLGYEALVRWPNSPFKNLDPSEFIPIAESTGLMPTLGNWVLNEAFEQAARWKDSPMNSPIAVNLSALQFFQEDLLFKLDERLERVNITPENIELEITESSVMHNLEQAISTMRVLRDKGFNISLDDFGTGYSSLSWLKHFPINTIKIDQSFVQNMQNSHVDAAIIRSIILLGHSLGKRVIAEGVETQEQKKFLRDEGCDAFQGYLYCKPMSAAELITKMERITH